jgi:hypothetical protein
LPGQSQTDSTQEPSYGCCGVVLLLFVVIVLPFDEFMSDVL